MADEPNVSADDVAEELTAALAQYQVTAAVEVERVTVQPFVGAILWWLAKVVVEGSAFDVIKKLGKGGIKKLHRRASEGDVALTIADAEDTVITLPKELTDEAAAALQQIEWRELKGGEIVWSEKRKRWERPVPVLKDGDHF